MKQSFEENIVSTKMPVPVEKKLSFQEILSTSIPDIPTPSNTLKYPTFFQANPTSASLSALSPIHSGNSSILDNTRTAFQTLMDVTVSATPLLTESVVSSAEPLCSVEEFIKAIATNNFNALVQLQGWQRFIHGRDPQGLTPLHLTAVNGCTECLTLLLRQGADSNVTNNQGWTPLHLAVCANQPDCVDVLLQNAAQVDAIDEKEGCTPLHLTANNGQISLMLKLLANGANVNSRDNVGWAALHHATYKGNAVAVQTLLQYQANCLLQTHAGWTALDIAQAVKNSELVVEYLARAEQQLFKQHYRLT